LRESILGDKCPIVPVISDGSLGANSRSGFLRRREVMESGGSMVLSLQILVKGRLRGARKDAIEGKKKTLLRESKSTPKNSTKVKN